MAATPAIQESSTATLPQQSPLVSNALPPIKVDSQDEFIGKLVKHLYKSLKCCLPIIFKNTCTYFASWRVIFSQAIENIWDVRGVAKAESLEEMVNNLERNIGEWNNLRQLDLTPLVEAEQEYLEKQMKMNYLETSQEIEALVIIHSHYHSLQVRLLPYLNAEKVIGHSSSAIVTRPR